jgi:hypothetical protein
MAPDAVFVFASMFSQKAGADLQPQAGDLHLDCNGDVFELHVCRCPLYVSVTPAHGPR